MPQFGRNRLGSPLLPERSRAYEAGIKQELFDGKLALTAAAFEIVKVGILQGDPVDINYVLNGRTAKSDGFEIEFQGRTPVTGLTVHGSVAYANVRLTESNDFPVGSKLVGPRPWTALLDFRQDLGAVGVTKGWVGASAYYAGKAVAAIPDNDQRLPAFTRFDLAAGKTFGPFELQVNIRNVTDDRIFIGNGGGLILFDNPRTFSATIRYALGGLP